MRLDSVHFSMLVVGVSLACYSPSLNSLQDQAHRSAVVIEGKVQSAPANASVEPYSVHVKVLDVWPRNSGGLEREQLVTVGDFGSAAPCATVLKNHKYIFFMEPTDEPLVFKASFAPLDTSAKNLKKDVGRILCEDCGAPTLKPMRNPVMVEEGSRLTMKCEASGTPPLSYKWYKDGTVLKKSKEIKIKGSKKNSKIQIASARLEDSGNYMCVVENEGGSSNSTSTVHVQSITTTLPPGSGHARRCNDTEKGYCVNDGECYFIHGINQLSCKCPNDFTGRSLVKPTLWPSFYQSLGIEFMEAEELYQKRVLTITGICVALLVVGIVCVVAYCKTKKQRKKMHNHLRQNMCVDHPNRNLANGPNHPGPGPEEIPMVDYISKNVPATERVIRHGAEASFSGSRQSSRSHNSSTRAHSSTHRHEERTWSLERTDSVLSDCPSGMLSSSVGTSKCSSPACMEARARRAAHCGFPEPHRPPLQYGDSFDSLGDSPHSDRYVSALTTPARLSPVDFHYSLPQQVPTFQITSPNASHAASLPPAARAPYPPPQEEEDHPLLLRRYQVPLHEAQRYQPYRQQHQQRQSYLRDSPGSLPSSPQLPAQDEEYESTQEYPASASSLEQPKRSGRRSWRRSRLNGHVAPRGYRPPRDYGSRSCLSDSGSEEEEEEEGESTPFLSMQNMSIPEPSTIYRPAPPVASDTRTPHSAAGRHAARSSTQGSSSSRQTHARSKPDRAAH
ncbi:neuregulin 2a isoform X3 [Pygocentrus nattereri]|uniref:neuregulin 2a isoform X3 n=1 Tax=Pygocentrus nattereri TaxID=42514 RepID=UPI001891375D|nr:neuregulin 2a isoform X3 [Pygocentrus nattereri]